jgi:hypothetical protein
MSDDDFDGYETDEDRAHEAIQATERLVGEHRFGGGWIDRSNPNVTWVGVAVVEPTQADLDAILALPLASRWSISITGVRYSRAQLIGFYEHARPPQNGAISGFGWDPRLNRVVVHMSRLDGASIQYFRGRAPDDALQFVFDHSRAVATDMALGLE